MMAEQVVAIDPTPARRSRGAGKDRLGERLAVLDKQLEALTRALGQAQQAGQAAADGLSHAANVARREYEVAVSEAEQVRQAAREAENERQRLAEQVASLQSEARAQLTELQRIRAETAQIQAESVVASERRAGLLAETAAAEARAEKMTEQWREAESQLAETRAKLTKAKEAAKRLHAATVQLERHYQELQAQGRPLQPYVPPARLPQIALVDQQLGTRLHNLDYCALTAYAKSEGVEIRAVVMEALRNWLPGEAYEVALGQLQDRAFEGAKMVETERFSTGGRRAGHGETLRVVGE